MSDLGRIKVIGRGRVGGAVAARLAERNVLVDAGDADLIVICVPDSVIGGVARSLPVGPWIAHVSGATLLSALEPHTRRFSVHPLQTFTQARGPEQMDGAWAAVTGEADAARGMGRMLADMLGLRAFDLADDQRAMYHAGAAMASNFLVTLHRAAVRAVSAAGAPPEALLPLMQRTIDNGFDLTGPIARGDMATVEAHRSAIRQTLPDLEPMYLALADATRR